MDTPGPPAHLGPSGPSACSSPPISPRRCAARWRPPPAPGRAFTTRSPCRRSSPASRTRGRPGRGVQPGHPGGLAARGPRWLHTTGAGVERLLFPELVASDVVVTNSRGAHRVAMPEFVLMAMLAWTHHLPALIRAQSRREWVKPVPDEVAGKTLGLLGLRRDRAGGGGESRRPRRALPRPAPAPESGRRRRRRARLRAGRAAGVPRGLRLRGQQPAPDRRDARACSTERALRAMRPGAVLINLGRGPTVVEADLLRALRERWIGGAVLDVFDAEPCRRIRPSGSWTTS